MEKGGSSVARDGMRTYNLCMETNAIHNLKILKDRRRELRKNLTPTEKILWLHLRNNRLGPKFKRQYSIGGYILDFYSPKHKLGVELDGEVHNNADAKEYDKVRDKYFVGQGFKVLRFKNSEVEDNLQNVLQKIKSYCVERI